MATNSDTITPQNFYNVRNEFVVYYKPVAGRIADGLPWGPFSTQLTNQRTEIVNSNYGGGDTH